MISGILPVDKPAGWTSHDVVARIRRAAGQKAVGHAGTLDPLATGVLIVVLGNATKLSPYLMETPKEYYAEVVLGATTATDDAEAPLLERREVGDISAQTVVDLMTRFVGEIDQIPPLYAAVKQKGQKLYVLARKGVSVEPQPRRVRVESIDILSWASPRLQLRVRCGSGTYLRSLARDIGAALGVGGYLHALRRTASGQFTECDLAPLAALADREAVCRALVPIDRAVLHLPALVLNEREAVRARTGAPLALGAPAQGTVRLYDPTGTLLGLGQAEGETVKAFRVFEDRPDAGRR